MKFLRESIKKIEPEKLETQIQGLNLFISYDSKRMGCLHSKKFDETKVKEFLLDLINSEYFQDKLKEIRDKNKLMVDSLNKFKEGLRGLLDDIGIGKEVKGKCDRCPSFWRV